MGHSSFLLPLMQHRLAGLLRFPNPKSLLRPLTRNCVGKFAQYLLVNDRPDLKPRQGRIKANIESCVIGIIKTLQQSKRGRKLLVTAPPPAPEGAPIRQGIEFVKQHASIPERLALVVDPRRLPLIDRIAPVRSIQ